LKRSFIFALIGVVLAGVNLSASDKQIVGWVENVSILPDNLTLKAKVDTGADNSSITARNITAVHRDGRRFLQFDVENGKGGTVRLEREQVGIDFIRRHHGNAEERPLVILEICLGKHCRNTLVNLADRSRHKYPLLLGRSFLLDRTLVNPSAKHIAEPRR
jgi:hypothetical protein